MMRQENYGVLISLIMLAVIFAGYGQRSASDGGGKGIFGQNGGKGNNG